MGDLIVKAKKQQDNLYSEKILNELLYRVILKHQVQEKIKKIKEIWNQLFLDLQLLNNCTIVYQDLLLKEIIRIQEKQRKKQVCKNIDEIVEDFCSNTIPQIAELTVEEVMVQTMEHIDMSENLSTIDQVLSEDNDEIINVGEQILNEESIDPEEPAVLHQFRIGDLIENTIDRIYD